MNGTFHIIQSGGEEIWLDGESVERLTKYDEGEDTSRFYVEVRRKVMGIGLAQQPEKIFSVAAIFYYPNNNEIQKV